MTSVVSSSFTDSVISRSPWNSEGSFALVHVNICMAVHSSGEVLLGHGCTHSVNSEQLYKAKRKKKTGLDGDLSAPLGCAERCRFTAEGDLRTC